MATKKATFKTEYMGMPFEGTMEEFKQFMIAVRETVPSTIGDGSSKKGYTEKEKELWRKGRIFGLIYSKAISDLKVEKAINGYENLEELERKAEQSEKIRADYAEFCKRAEEYKADMARDIKKAAELKAKIDSEQDVRNAEKLRDLLKTKI